MLKKYSGKRKFKRKMSTTGTELNPDTVLVPRNSPISTVLSLNRNPNTTEPLVVSKCWHCENMAKNFLYLESLIRSNFNENCKCQTCSNSLKYLEFVNRNIKKYFGNFDTIVEVAKAFQVENKIDSTTSVKPKVKKAAKKIKNKKTKFEEKSTKSKTNTKSKSKGKKEVKSSTVKKSKSSKKVSVKKAASNTKSKKKAVSRVVVKTAVPKSKPNIKEQTS